MEILFIQLSDYVNLNFTKLTLMTGFAPGSHLFIYLFILCFKNDYSFFMIEFFSQMSRIIRKNYKLHFKIRKEIDRNNILL